MTELEDLLQCVGIGPRAVNDPYFDESYKICNLFERKGVTIEDEEELCHKVMEEFTCNVPGCKEEFQNLLDFEIHYNGFHRYVCDTCKKSLPTPRILDIHIQEIHDTFFQVLAERQPLYQCYDSECDMKFSNSAERKEHCMSVHKFPKNFRFDSSVKHKTAKQKADHIGTEQLEKSHKSKTMYIALNKNQKAKSFQKCSSLETQDMKHNVESAISNPSDLQPSSTNSTKKSSLMFTPRQVLQKSYAKILTQTESNEKEVLVKESMMDLAESLPKI